MKSATLQVEVTVRRRSAGGTFALNASFEVPSGITAIMGSSGSGKSTLLSIVAGLIQPDGGRIAIGDEVWFDAAQRIDRPSHQRRLGMAFQSAALFPHMTALGNVEFALCRKMPRRERRERARALLAQMKIEHLANRYTRHISGGEAQRVSLARALARSPKVVLLDEPFCALDPQLRVRLAAEVCEHLNKLNVPVLFVTHDMEEARVHGARSLLVENGAVRLTTIDARTTAAKPAVVALPTQLAAVG